MCVHHSIHMCALVGFTWTYIMYGCLGEGGFLILLSSTVGIKGDFDRDLDLDLLLDDDEDEEELELELDRDERDEELDDDLQQSILTLTHNQ